MSKFRLGDRVRVTSTQCLGTEDALVVQGKTGIVRAFMNTKKGMGLRYVGVDFGPQFGGHDLNSTLKRRTGRYYFERELTLVKAKAKSDPPSLLGKTVVLLRSVDGKGRKGKRGTVVLVDSIPGRLGIDFGAGFEGHALNGAVLPKGVTTGWYVTEKDVRIAA
jgi:hypothetical protein